MSPIPGHDEYIVDAPVTGASSIGTDTMYLLHSAGGPTPVVQRQANTGVEDLDADLRAFFNIVGKGGTVYLQGVGTGGAGANPTLTNAIGLLPKGPGQVVAPEHVTSADIVQAIPAAWAENKIYLANGPSTDAPSDLETLVAAIIAGCDGRSASLLADWYQFTNLSGTGVDNVTGALVLAALLARNDLTLQNQNIAAAGVNGIVTPAVGLLSPLTDAEITTLNEAQVTCAKIVQGTIRNYGIRTLANLETDPLWWDLPGTRTVMAYRDLASNINEDFAFAEIDGQGQMLNRLETRLRTAGKQLQTKGALYGYDVDMADVNSLQELQAGDVVAQVYLQTSPSAEHLTTNITRRDLDATI